MDGAISSDKIKRTAEAVPWVWKSVVLSLTFYHERGWAATSNEELVLRVQAGEQDLIPSLWAQVERFVRQQARRRAQFCVGAVEFDDLYQSGFLALVAAVETFDPDRGMSFIGWMVPHLKTAFNEAAGTRSERQKLDPIHRANSLDQPVNEDGDELADLVADPLSAQGFEEAETRLWKENYGRHWIGR